MKRTLRNISLLILAVAAGWAASEIFSRAVWSRNVIGAILGRGKLVAVVRGQAIHEHDVSRGDAVAETMAMAAALRGTAGQTEAVAVEEVAREYELLRSQFGDDEHFAAALAASGITEEWLRTLLADHLTVRRALETSIAPQLARDGGRVPESLRGCARTFRLAAPIPRESHLCRGARWQPR